MLHLKGEHLMLIRDFDASMNHGTDIMRTTNSPKTSDGKFNASFCYRKESGTRESNTEIMNRYMASDLGGDRNIQGHTLIVMESQGPFTASRLPRSRCYIC